MRLSVVVPVYNIREAVIGTLVSLARLDPPPHEVIVVDDGSTDGSGQVVESFVESHPLPRFVHIRQANAGVSVARNVGLTEVTGDYVLFLDGDDTVEPELVKVVAEAHAAHPPFVDLVCWRYHDEKQEAFGQGLGGRWGELPSSASGVDVMRRLLIRHDFFMHISSVAYRVDFLRDEKLHFTLGCAVGEDTEFHYKALARAARVLAVSSVLSTYVWRPASVLNTFDSSHFDSVAARIRVADFLITQDDSALVEFAEVFKDQAVRRFVDHLKEFARGYPGGSAQVLAAVEESNPGMVSQIGGLIRERKRAGLVVPRNWTLLRAWPWLWVKRVRWKETTADSRRFRLVSGAPQSQGFREFGRGVGD